MNMLIREMKQEEKEVIMKISTRAFRGSIEKFFVSSPKNALVAVLDGQIAGALLYKFFDIQGRKIGYVDFFFVDPAFHGKGVGTRLLEEGLEFLRAAGCEGLSAVIKDDNVASWGLFRKNGFTRVSLVDMVRLLGFGGALKQYFGTSLCFAVGMEYYLVLKGQQLGFDQEDSFQSGGKNSNVTQFGFFILFNLILLFPKFFTGIANFGMVLGGYTLVLLALVFSGFLGTRLSKESWHFRFMDGGALITTLVNLYSFFPMIGTWYPGEYSQRPEFLKAMGRVGLGQWCFVLLMAGASHLGLFSLPMLAWAGIISTHLLLYFILAFYPFQAFGGARVWRWNRWIFTGMAILSLVVFAG